MALTPRRRNARRRPVSWRAGHQETEVLDDRTETADLYYTDERRPGGAPVPVIRVRRMWYCQHCTQTDMTTEARPHSRLHTCPGLRGIIAPFIEVGTKAKVEVKDREDYVGDEMVQTDENGRPVMSVVTTRDDGSNDTIVFAPAARITAREV